MVAVESNVLDAVRTSRESPARSAWNRSRSGRIAIPAAEAHPVMDRFLLLASRSPRRSALLAEHGYQFNVIESGIDDGTLSPGTCAPADWVAALAYLKAASAAWSMESRSNHEMTATILGADTVVVSKGEIMGQPRDEAHARCMIRALQSGTHDVLTGVALIQPHTGLRDMFVDRAFVRVGPIAEVEIERYVGSGLWRGKAGGYNLAERLAANWPIEFDGDPGTIMGLPMSKLRDRLARFWSQAAD